jgi:hypothetical protein
VNLYNNGNIPGVDDPTYPIDLTSDKILLSKLMEDNTFKERYFDIFNFILDSVFVTDDIFQLIEANASLIRDAVYADTNFAFTTDDFEYDIEMLCKPAKTITSIKRFIQKRKEGLEKEYGGLYHSEGPIDPKIEINDIVINELAANNKDDSGKTTDDWIELYNRTNTILSLKNLGLSDTITDRFVFEFPDNTAIIPDGYIIVLADKKDKKNNLHANFKLSADGEELYLTHKNFGTIDSVVFGEQSINKSYGRLPNGTGPFVVLDPTFNQKNEAPSNVQHPLLFENGVTFIIYPNPAKDYIYIQPIIENIEFAVKIYNSNGRLMNAYSSGENGVSVNVSEFPDGLYIIELFNQSKCQRFKVVVSH